MFPFLGVGSKGSPVGASDLPKKTGGDHFFVVKFDGSY